MFTKDLDTPPNIIQLHVAAQLTVCNISNNI